MTERGLARSITGGLALLMALEPCAQGQDSLPFPPAEPHPDLVRLSSSEGTYSVRSVMYDGEGRPTDERGFRVVASPKVMGHVLMVDTYMEGTNTNVQTSMIVHRDGRVLDIAVTPNGFVEFWDQISPGQGEVFALQLRGQARLMTQGAGAQALHFRKAFRRVTRDRYELVYSVSEDGEAWHVRFEETGTRIRP